MKRLRPDQIGAALVASIVTGYAINRWQRGLSPLRADLGRRLERTDAPGLCRLSIVIPAYGEEQRIALTVQSLRSTFETAGYGNDVEIIVVDDGSLDRTAEIAKASGADVVVRHELNRGKGAAIRSGVLAANGRAIIFTDADLSYSPDQMPALVELVEKGWDVVVGSRRHTETTTLVRAKRIREIGGRAINLLTRVVLLGQYRDTQCGLKAFRSDAARLIFSHTMVDGFAFDVEVFHLVERYHLSLTEVPVTVANAETSTVRVVRDALRLVRDLFLVRRWSVEGRYDLTANDLLSSTTMQAASTPDTDVPLH
ncbi:WcaA Glycosyltransferases involved in cell wall biogenesis [Acidimicrobiia bacterium]